MCCIYYYFFTFFYQEKAQINKVHDKWGKESIFAQCEHWLLALPCNSTGLEAHPTSGSITCNPSDWDVLSLFGVVFIVILCATGLDWGSGEDQGKSTWQGGESLLHKLHYQHTCQVHSSFHILKKHKSVREFWKRWQTVCFVASLFNLACNLFEGVLEK